MAYNQREIGSAGFWEEHMSGSAIQLTRREVLAMTGWRARRCSGLSQRGRAGGTTDLGCAHLAGANLVRSGGYLGDHHAVHGALRAARRGRETDAGTNTGAKLGAIVVGLGGWPHL